MSDIDKQIMSSRRVILARMGRLAHLHRNRLFVVRGLIVGNLDDTRESIDANLAFARAHVDWP
jgi:anaerobic magnesium-protoporphyrin IX monomethyl ester cyclase